MGGVPVRPHSRDWVVVYYLFWLTCISSALAVLVSQPAGSYFYWISLAVSLGFFLLQRRYWESFLVLLAALATLSVFQAGIIMGYRSWYYTAIIAVLLLSCKFGPRYLKAPGFSWWLSLLFLGTIHLVFSEYAGETVEYARGAVVQVAVGLSAFGLSYLCIGLRERLDAIRQLSFLVFSVCSVSLLVPILLAERGIGRLGEELGMDANGLGITAVYSMMGLLVSLYLSRGRSRLLTGILVSALLIVALVRSGSRQAIAAILLMLGVSLFIALRNRVYLPIVLTLVGLLIGLSALVSVSEIDYLQDRFDRVLGPTGTVDRIDHLKVSLYMVADHPFGLGGGGFKEYFNEYKNKAGIETYYTRINPHTLYGMVIADWGIPGIFLLLGGFAAILLGLSKLRGVDFYLRFLSFVTYVFLANAGMSFPPVLMMMLGMPPEGTVRTRTVQVR